MKKNLLVMLFAATLVVACTDEDSSGPEIVLEDHSATPNFLSLSSEFSGITVNTLLTSEDVLEETPDFVYGSMADGAGLMKNDDGTYTLINNIEADYSIARITFDETFAPVAGEYILNASATSFTAQCSGSLITQDEHGFGPLYLSGGEWGGDSKGVFLTDPFKDDAGAGTAEMLTALGQWSTENAVAIGQDAYAGKTVVFIGDDHSDDEVPSGQLGMYVGDQGDLENGSLHVLRVTASGIDYEMDMEEGEQYAIDFVEVTERTIDALDAEAKEKGAMGFSRLEDVDWRRGSAANQREVYFAVTGRQKDGLIGKGSVYGRIYKVTLNETDPTGAGTIELVLDGDNLDGIASAFSSPDNILVTENYAYIQEDPNGYFDTAEKTHYARLYQYDLNTGTLKVVLEANQDAAAAAGYGTTDSIWELTGMIDVSDIVGANGTFVLIAQAHGWVPENDADAFTDTDAYDTDPAGDFQREGSMLFLLSGLDR